MAARKQRKRTPAGPVPVDSIAHGEKRVNIPTNDAQDFVDEALRVPNELLYPRDPELDPQLVWHGKDVQDADDLVVDAPPIFIQEKVDPRVLIENLRNTASRPDEEPELTLFESFDGLGGMEAVEFYKHAANWSNRLILGDSLQVMASLADRESLQGQVQMIYMDPPYGIRFGSNWQVRTDKREVKDRVADATRDVEQIKAFRDTWELGIHSYLAYLRDRLTVARDLLTASGSVFVQIGDDNVHLVRSVLDEVYGSANFVSLISFATTSGFAQATALGRAGDYLLWYAKDLSQLKSRPLWYRSQDRAGYRWLILPDGTRRAMTRDEQRGEVSLPEGAVVYAAGDLQSQGAASSDQPFTHLGKTYRPTASSHWKANYPDGMNRLAWAGRIHVAKDSIRYVRREDDFGYQAYTNVWTDTGTGNFTDDKVFVVQTNTKVVQRCIALATDPGDLVLDPTCGSGTTAVAAETLGRRWITIDTSRVALTIARTRLMTSRFPYFLLADSKAGMAREAELAEQEAEPCDCNEDIRRGLVYQRARRVTLESIATNPVIVEGMSREDIDEAIAQNAETVLFYDKPIEDPTRVRVAGPFTVESLSPHRAVGDDSDASTVDQQSTQTFEEMLLENLKLSGVQNGRRSERFQFDEIERLPGKYLQARAIPTGQLAADSVAISIGSRYGTVGADWIKSAAREAMRGQGHDVLMILGFAFDPRADQVVEEFTSPSEDPFAVQGEQKLGGIRILLVRMNADLAMGDRLLKKSKAANLFTVFGEPDIDTPAWTEDGWVITIRGFDVYNPLTGEVRAGDSSEIAAWLMDTDYNEESFFVRHAYFLGSEPYKALSKALKADINADAWASLNSAKSRPFPHPSRGKVAIKVINHYGDELMTVLDLPAPTRTDVAWAPSMSDSVATASTEHPRSVSGPLDNRTRHRGTRTTRGVTR
ncbi:site-specific DNA-methyltransferase [Mycobacterium intracellulare]|uniref:site-specific DNA-methyltransferase n=1 Tax=Mycobacterium intracellulare TaxID=1767 RepID=UPI0009F38F12|nr:site-specific DNA-methyltransferase [Mycobacterium intracellulare]